MTNSRTYFELAQLSEASYANLVSPQKLKDDVRNAQFMTEPFSLTQATELADHWNVITHQPNTDSGFSSTMFQNADDGGYVLAIRGTGGIDWQDLIQTDSADIAVDGIAIDQIIDLYNEMQVRTTNAAGYSSNGCNG